MKSSVGGLIVAIILFAGAGLSWREAGLVREAAAAHERLVTLRYGSADSLASQPAAPGRLDELLARVRGDDTAQRAAVAYWLGDYEALTSSTGASSGPGEAGLRLIAANAAFRAGRPMDADPKAGVARLDEVIQTYAAVLRDHPQNEDAAYNYEFVVRLRDTLARERPGSRNVRRQPTEEALESASFDLPPGPTIHGRPGGPPPTVPTGQFKATTPMNYEEREQMPEPTAGSRLRRRG